MSNQYLNIVIILFHFLDKMESEIKGLKIMNKSVNNLGLVF